MGLLASQSAKQIYAIIAPMQGNLLTLHNYEEWRFHMTWSLISQGLWHVVRGQNCSDITLDKDDIVFRSIMFTIDNSLRSKILQRSFLSAKELWDYLRFQFGQTHDQDLRHANSSLPLGDARDEVAIMAAMIADTDVHQEDIPDTFRHDDYKIVENLGEGQAARIKQEHTMSNEDNVHDISPSSMIQTSFDIADYAVTEMFSESSPLYIAPVPVLQVDLIQDICNEIEDEHMIVSCEWSADFYEQGILSDLIMDTAADVPVGYIRAACFENDHKFTLQSASEELKLASFSMDHKQFHIKEEQISKFPWVDLHATLPEFGSTMAHICTQQLELPCSHDGRLEDHPNLPECLGYVPHYDVGELNKMSKISYSCKHKQNQVLFDLHNSVFLKRDDMVSDRSALAAQLLKQSLTLGMVGLPKECYELQVLPFMAERCSNCQVKTFTAESVVSCTCFQDSAGHLHGFNLGLKAEYGSLQRQRKLFYTVPCVSWKRAWYRGRMLWFSTNIKWQPWLLLWLNLLRMLNSFQAALYPRGDTLH